MAIATLEGPTTVIEPLAEAEPVDTPQYKDYVFVRCAASERPRPSSWRASEIPFFRIDWLRKGSSREPVRPGKGTGGGLSHDQYEEGAG
jgi:hypothetical protein